MSFGKYLRQAKNRSLSAARIHKIRIDAGLCVQCAAPREQYARYCDICRAAASLRERDRKRAIREKGKQQKETSDAISS